MKTCKPKQAFTLPEVVITSVILMILMIPIARIAYSTTIQTRFAKDMGSAVSVGLEQLEELSNTPYASIASGSSSSENMNLSWTVSEENSAKVVNLTISWDTVGKPHQINLNTVYIDDIDGGFSN